jgi:hypothetical protein
MGDETILDKALNIRNNFPQYHDFKVKSIEVGEYVMYRDTDTPKGTTHPILNICIAI